MTKQPTTEQSATEQPAAPSQSFLHSPTGLMFFIVGFVTMLRLVVLPNTGMTLHFDEAQYWVWAQNLDFGYYSKPPLIAWIIRLFTTVMGHEESVIRTASPLFHAGTSVMIYYTAVRLFRESKYAQWSGLFSAVSYLLLPGVFYSSLLITTDVPLLFFWSVALYAFVRCLEGDRNDLWIPALGVAVGLGFLAKYAMIYFLLSAAVALVVRRPARPEIWRQFLLALGIAFAILLPHLIWNMANGWVTFAHTADNANWAGPIINPEKLIQFGIAQVFIAGPFVLWAFLKGATQTHKNRLFLLAFTVPVLALMCAQALISRAHGNWAAVSFISLCMLAGHWFADPENRTMGWMMTAAHGVLGMLFYLMLMGSVFTVVSFPSVFYKWFRGWDDAARRVYLDTARQFQIDHLVVPDRKLASYFSYYLRNVDVEVWIEEPRDGQVRNYFHMKKARPGIADKETAVLRQEQADVQGLSEFPITIPSKKGPDKTFYLYTGATRANAL